MNRPVAAGLLAAALAGCAHAPVARREVAARPRVTPALVAQAGRLGVGPTDAAGSQALGLGGPGAVASPGAVRPQGGPPSWLTGAPEGVRP